MKSLLAPITLMSLSTGCGQAELQSVSDRRAYTTADAWHVPPPDTLQFTSLPTDRYTPVSADNQPEAVKMLADVACVPLSVAEAEQLTGRSLPADGRHVLLRAVVLNEQNGAYSVGIVAGAVRVQHGCLGRRAVSMKRRAIVAVLPAVPEVVYVTCSMAQ